MSRSWKTEQLFQTEGEWRDVRTKYNVWFWAESSCCKGHYRNSWRNLNGVWGLNGSNVSLLISWFWWCYFSYVGQYPWLQEIHSEIFWGDMASGQQLILKGKKHYLYGTSNFSVSLWLFQSEKSIQRMNPRKAKAVTSSHSPVKQERDLRVNSVFL